MWSDSQEECVDSGLALADQSKVVDFEVKVKSFFRSSVILLSVFF